MKNKILELEEKLRQAMLASDVSILDELIANSLIFTAQTGNIISKQADLEAHRSGIQKLTALNPSEHKISFYDNFAVVAVKIQLKGSFNNKSIDGTYSYTRVWANINNKWQVVAGHVSLIKM